jgi:NAD+-dependent secondary alcohol dehydrogenase Adh1
MSLTGGRGAEAVLDFVGERGVPEQGFRHAFSGRHPLRRGYGERANIPNWDFVIREINVVEPRGQLHGAGGADAPRRARRGSSSTQTYSLDDINQAIDDLNAGRLPGGGSSLRKETSGRSRGAQHAALWVQGSQDCEFFL